MEKKTRERVKRGHKIPTDYIASLADRIHQTTPTLEILKNTLTGFYSVAYTRGYFRDMGDTKFFRDRREQDFQEAWKSIRDELDDQMNPQSKNQNKK